MKIVKRIAATIALFAFVICMVGTIKVKADGPDVLKEMGVGDLTSMQYAYENLSPEQRLIVEYMIGAWNNIYLCARGFQYNIPSDEGSIKAEFLALGNRVLSYAFTRTGWMSRFNETFRQYISSCINYAFDQGNLITFQDWYNGIKYGGNNQLYIPYSEDAFDAWTTFYNDPSGDGIVSFGIYETTWHSGDWFDFAYSGYTWIDSNRQNNYNNFIVNYSPVLYGVNSGDGSVQVIAGDFSNIPNAMFVLRSSYFYNFRYGFSENNSIRLIGSERFRFGYLSTNYVGNKLGFSDDGYKQFDSSIFHTVNTYTNLQQFISTAFATKVPISYGIASGNGISEFIEAYPFIEHVYLVDDLNTLSNPEEVFSTTDLDLVAPVNPYYIVAPNDKLILPLWPIADDDPMNLWENIKDNSLKPDGTPATDDDFNNQIVNNTVINNYYVNSGEEINVPANWFDNDFTATLFEDSQDLFNFTADCIGSLGNVKIYMYGAIVIGLAGGVVNKLLL